MDSWASSLVLHGFVILISWVAVQKPLLRTQNKQAEVLTVNIIENQIAKKTDEKTQKVVSNQDKTVEQQAKAKGKEAFVGQGKNRAVGQNKVNDVSDLIKQKEGTWVSPEVVQSNDLLDPAPDSEQENFEKVGVDYKRLDISNQDINEGLEQIKQQLFDVNPNEERIKIDGLPDALGVLKITGGQLSQAWLAGVNQALGEVLMSKYRNQLYQPQDLEPVELISQIDSDPVALRGYEQGGNLQLAIGVDATGKVFNVVIINNDQLPIIFEQTTVEQWRYAQFKPARVKSTGEAVASYWWIELNFKSMSQRLNELNNSMR